MQNRLNLSAAVPGGMRPRTSRAALAVIVIAYWALGVLFAVRTPAWQAPDEPAHYNTVRQIAEGEDLRGCCPVIREGDWDQDYLETLKAARFAPELLAGLDSVQYEDHQPPLYYLLAVPVYRLTGGDLLALRLFSVAVGTLIVVSAYGVGATLYSRAPQIGLGAAAFVAFQPMHIALLASVNNDALGWALVGLILWASVWIVMRPERLSPLRAALLLGVLAGLGLLTKATVYPLAAVAGLAVVLHARAPAHQWVPRLGSAMNDLESVMAAWYAQQPARDDLVVARPIEEALTPQPPLPGGEGEKSRRRPFAGLGVVIRASFVYLAVALALGALWWLRNFDVYGFPDFLGLAAHDAVVVAQARTDTLIAEVGAGEYLRIALRDTYNSFWGQFGWMALPLVGEAVGWVYPAIAGFLAFSALGWVVALARPLDAPDPRRRWAWTLLALTVALALAAYVYYNSEFLQLQGRYTFTLLIPLGLALALGVDTWRRLIVGRVRASGPLTPLAFFAFAALDVWLIWRIIPPNLAP